MRQAGIRDAEFQREVANLNVNTADVGEKPTNYKELLESSTKAMLKDPDSAKFSNFTEPKKEVMVANTDFVYGYSICFSVNAKNSYGGYVGNQLYWGFIRNGKVLRVQNTTDAYGNMIFIGRPVTCS